MLRAVKQMVRAGRLEEAAQVYQQALGASAEEARRLVEALASGQSVMISSANFSQVLPVASETQVFSTQVQVFSDGQAAGEAQDFGVQQMQALNDLHAARLGRISRAAQALGMRATPWRQRRQSGISASCAILAAALGCIVIMMMASSFISMLRSLLR
jgi:hypothetical protein